jgi:hypothetical protein
MTEILINNSRYKILTSWEELTVEKVSAFSDIQMPAKMRALLDKPTDENMQAISDDEYRQQMIPFFRSCLGVFSNIAWNIIEAMDDERLFMVYNLCADLVTDVFKLNFVDAEFSKGAILTKAGMLRPVREVEGVKGMELTIDQYCQCMDLIEQAKESRVDALTYLPAVLNGWSDGRALKSKNLLKRYKFTKIVAFFFKCWRWLKRLSSVFQRRSTRQGLTAKGSRVERQRPSSLSLQARDMVVWLN